MVEHVNYETPKSSEKVKFSMRKQYVRFQKWNDDIINDKRCPDRNFFDIRRYFS